MKPSVERGAYVLLVFVAFLAGGLAFYGWVNVVRDLAGPNRIIVPIRTNREISAQLFFDRGSGIRAEDCSTVSVPGRLVFQDVTFAVPRVPIRELRFDPMPGSGHVELLAPRLESASGRLIAAFPLHAIVARNQIGSLTTQGNRVAVDTALNANDPQLTFGLGAPLRVGEPRMPLRASVIAGALTLLAFYVSRRPANRGQRIIARLAAECGALLGKISPQNRTGVTVGGVLVLVVQGYLLWPIHRTIDWPLWDEVNYAARGQLWDWKNGLLGVFSSSPLYVVSYAALTHATKLAAAIFVQHYLCKIASSALLYLLFVHWWKSWLAALSAALIWSLAGYQLEAALLVYHSAFVWFVAGLAAMDLFPLLGIACFLAATATRQEYAFAALAALVWLVWSLQSRRWTWLFGLGGGRNRMAAWGATAGATLLVAMVCWVSARSTFGGSDSRAWFAFEQHYALRAAQTGHYGQLNPLLDFPVIISKEFPGATSLRTAFSANPGAFTSHVLRNAKDASAQVASLLSPHAGLWGAAALFGCVWVLALCAAVVPTGVIERTVAPSILFSATALLIILPGLIVLAADRYLLPMIPVVFAAGGCVIRACARGRQWRSWVSCAAPPFVIAGMLWLFIQPRVFEPGSRPRPVAETVDQMATILPRDRHQVLVGASATSFAHYLGDWWVDGVEVFSEASGVSGKGSDLLSQLKSTGATAVIVTEAWTTSGRFSEVELADAMNTGAWRLYPVAAGRLYVRQPAQ